MKSEEIKEGPRLKSPEKNLEDRIESLSRDLFEKFKTALDINQKEDKTSLAGFPGIVESVLQECWIEFLNRNKLESSTWIQAGAAAKGNSCGFMHMSGESLPIYTNSNIHLPGGLLPQKFSERLLYDNIKASIVKMLKDKELTENART